MRILLLLADGVEMIEAGAFIDVFGWARHYNCSETNVVTCGLRKEIHSTFNIPLRVDLLIDEINADDYDALAIPGGFGDYGFYDDAYNEKFLDVIRKFNAQGKFIASICVGALPIGKSGVLQGRSATTYHLMSRRRQVQLEAFGVNIVDEPVVIDKNIITSWCPSTAVDVALKLLELLTSAEVLLKTREIMGF